MTLTILEDATSLPVLAIAALLDFLIGDPPQWLHPVQVMGWVISRYTQVVLRFLKQPYLLKLAGVGLGLGLIAGSGGVGWAVGQLAERVHPVGAIALQSILLASCFAGRSLRRAADEVLEPLHLGDLPEARSRLSRYVGRDTENLSEAEILRAVLETVTENATDGVMAPLFWAIVGACTPLGSVPFALAYKAASTLDSMVGYREPPYTDLGWFSARFEDGLTWIPCRLTVLTLALLSGKPHHVLSLCRRDAPQDPSPNAGWSECAYAAVLGVQVGGANLYRGKVKQKPLLGDPTTPITGRIIHGATHLTRSLFLLWLAAFSIGWLALSLPALASPPPTMPSNSVPSTSQPLSPEAALERLWTAPQIQREWFADSFLNQIPVAPEQIINELRGSLGAFRSIQSEANGYRVLFERGSLKATIALNDRGQIISLFFQEIQSGAIALPDAIQQLQTFPGRVNLLVLEDGQERAALNADQPLAVGSTFKLAVLAQLQKQIQAGQRRWGEVVELRAEDKSLPSGILQTWFDGALLTVQTLATLMISQSDNTATDALIRLVGRAAIESITPRNVPFLTTRELFILKAPQNATLLQRYQSGNVDQRRQVLRELVPLPLPQLTDVHTTPTALDVEWHFTPRELCALMAEVADLPLMSVTPGIQNPSGWARVSYKGGSEPGVLNLTTGLRSTSGKTYCVSATWNNDAAPLDDTRFIQLYSGVIESLLKL
jgi:adenosylcobinamide-phosphate synthase